MSDYSLSELCISVGADIFKGEGEVFTTLIGLVPRLAGSLAKLTHTPGIMMSDGEYYFVSEPVPIGPRGDYKPKKEGVINYERVFDLVYKGNRHCFVGPVQVDRYGQMNLSVVGDYHAPKSAILGVRGLPGNTINNRNSMFFPAHNTRAFVSGEVDMVSGAGYNPERYLGGKIPPFVDHRQIVTNLCVMDFEGPQHSIRVRSLHPGVSFEEVQENTGFELITPEGLGETPAPTSEQLKLIREVLDPHNLRATVFKDNPPGIRKAA